MVKQMTFSEIDTPLASSWQTTKPKQLYLNDATKPAPNFYLRRASV